MNIFAVFIAAAVAFSFGGFWYSPILFIKPWLKAAGVEELKPPPSAFAISAILTIVTSATLAYILGPDPALGQAVITGAILGAGIGAAGIGVNYQFAGRSTALWLIDGGFQVGRCAVMGLVLGLWP